MMSTLTLRLIALLLIVVIGTINSTSCPTYPITRAQYNSIQIGWTRAQVTAAVGNAGDLTSESAMELIVGYQGTTPGASASIIFLNGLVFTKTQTLPC